VYSNCIKGSFKFLHPGQNNRYLNLKKGFLSVLRFKSSDFFVLKFLPKRKKEKFILCGLTLIFYLRKECIFRYVLKYVQFIISVKFIIRTKFKVLKHSVSLTYIYVCIHIYRKEA